MSSDYRFLNPYNFVRYLPQGKENIERDIKLLGRCSPPPHDRFIGLTGRIECELEAVTPIFISDSEFVKEDKDNPEHKSYRFFRLINENEEKEFAIPSTSLKGMLRSVFEAATNSCFSVFEGEKRLSNHFNPRDAKKLVPGRLEEDESGKWRLRLLPGATRYNPNGPGGNDCLYAAWIKIYEPMRESATERQNPNTPYAKRANIVLSKGIKHGDRCFAVLNMMVHPAKRNKYGKISGKFYFWNVKAIAKTKEELPKPQTNNEKIEEGCFCLNFQNIESKHDERFFFRDINNNSVSKIVEIDDNLIEKYQALIKYYKERHKENIEQIRKKGGNPSILEGDRPAYSRFILEDTKNLNGELVYAMLGGQAPNLHIIFVAPLSVPRVAYDKLIGELLPKDYLHPCSDYNNLCPACRIFGWVHQNPPKDEKKVAYAGRVKISHAMIIQNTGTIELPLAILSTPKPTTTFFYLLKNGLPDPEVTYDTDGAELRGRKFYRHQEKAEEQEYKRVNNLKDSQNRTVRDALEPGAKFSFTIEFENLSPVELGALLWTIELEEGMHHKLGLAKPLGFGSVNLSIKNEDIKCLDLKKRYNSFTNFGWGTINVQKKKQCMTLFKEGMRKKYNKPFEQLENIKDLKAILSVPPSVLPTHYPRTSPKPDVSGRNFEWFTQHKRFGKKPLKIASEDTEGFPLNFSTTRRNKRRY
jgi:CRISPR-associated protein (TIGR03986 family)